MHGKEINVVSNEWSSFIRLGPSLVPGSTQVTPLDSLDIRIMNSMAAAANFTYSVRRSVDGEWGRLLPSNNWTGVVGTLERQEADISFTLATTPARAQVIDYTQVYAADVVVILTAKPSPLSAVLAIMRPLSYTVYALLLLMVLVMTFLIWGFLIIESPLLGVETTNPVDSFLLTFGILVEEVSNKKPKHGGAAVLLLTWLLFCLLVTTFYKSSLKSDLIIPKMSKPIESLDDLVQRNWTWGMGPTYGSIYSWMKTSDVPLIQQLFEGLEILPLEELIEKVLTMNHAFIYSADVILDVILKEHSDIGGNHPFHIAPTDAYPFWATTWGVRQGAPFLNRLSNMKQWLVATGHVDRWLKECRDKTIRDARMEKKKQPISGAIIKNMKTLGAETVLSMNHLQGAFYILIVGFVLSIQMLVCELLFWIYIRNRIPATG